MPRYKKASDGQWPGHPHLHINDIETLMIRQNKHVAKALVNNRKGRVVVLMDEDIFQKFLSIVRKRKGDISERHVNEAVIEAVEAWMKEKSSSK